MSEHRIEFMDENHVMLDGRQFISLERFFENRSEIAIEHQILIKENKQLVEENKNLKALLKSNL